MVAPAAHPEHLERAVAMGTPREAGNTLRANMWVSLWPASATQLINCRKGPLSGFDVLLANHNCNGTANQLLQGLD